MKDAYRRQRALGTPPEPRFVMDNQTPPACLPVELDTSDLLDITADGDRWRKYFDPVTGTTHDCADYYDQALELMRQA